MKRRILLSVLGAVVLFVWGAVGHAVLRIYDPVFHGFEDERAVTAVLEENAPARGIYYLPFAPDYEAPPVAEAFVNFLPAGERAGFARMMATGFVVHLVAVLLVLFLLGETRPQGYWRGVARFALAGFTIGFVVHAYYWNWFGFPVGYFLIALADTTLGWTLAGLALARFVSSEGKPVSPQVGTG